MQKGKNIMPEIKVKAVGKYHGHSVKPNGAVDLSFKLPYDELTSVVKTLQMLNVNITIMAKIEDDKPIKLGMLMLKNVTIDHDGEAVLKFNSQLDYVEADNINDLAKTERFTLLMKAEIEAETEADDE